MIVIMAKVFHLVIGSFLLIIRFDQSICTRCFCSSKQPQCPNPVCESEWCVVGFKNKIDLIQECANSSIDRITGCTANFQDWQEVCSCRVDFCNTFAFLREYNIRSNQDGGRYLDKRTKFQSKFYKSDIIKAEAFDYSNNDKFEKIFNQKFTNGPLLTNFDVYDDENNDRRHGDTDNDGSDNYLERKEKLNRKNRRQMNNVPRHYKINLNRTQQLTVLLIILPLVLGTATVLIIFINYHCKMCS